MEVSKLCFGTLTMGPLQANKSHEEGGELLLHGFRNGINFLDTADLYDNYFHIRHALKNWQRDKVVIATKSYAYSKQTAKETLDRALNEMDTDYIDIFLLHEQESEHTLRGHYEALEYLMEMKKKCYVRALGISTHTVRAVEASLGMDEIEIIHPIVNKMGLGIQDGSVEDMLRALEKAHREGKGIYGMKPLGGGNLLGDFSSCFEFVLGLSCLDSIAVGMQSKEEIDMNVRIFNEQPIDQGLIENIKKKERRLIIDEWCEKCGKCIERCGHKALKIKEDRVVVDHDKCVLCGYCSKECPLFCIKVI